MLLKSQEHADVMTEFEKRYKHKPIREDKSLWAMQHVYCDDAINQAFIVYREGYALAKSIYQAKGH